MIGRPGRAEEVKVSSHVWVGGSALDVRWADILADMLTVIIVDVLVVLVAVVNVCCAHSVPFISTRSC